MSSRQIGHPHTRQHSVLAEYRRITLATEGLSLARSTDTRSEVTGDHQEGCCCACSPPPEFRRRPRRFAHELMLASDERHALRAAMGQLRVAWLGESDAFGVYGVVVVKVGRPDGCCID